MKKSETDVPSTEGPQSMNKKKEWPYTTNHFDFIEHLPEVIKNYSESQISSQNLAKELDNVDEIGVSEDTMRAWLSTHRKYLDENSDVESFGMEDGSSGHTTVYWRLDK